MTARPLTPDEVQRPETAAQLADLIESLTVFDYADGGEGYERSADALWRAALAAFEYVARQLGVTGWQASWAALRFYREAMHVDGPFIVIRAHDALYPQYDLPERLAAFLAKQQPWLAEQAAEKLAEFETRQGADQTVAPAVLAHWRMLAKHRKATP